jgi:hypothetical protein
MHREQLLRTHTHRGAALWLWSCCCALLLNGACGIHDYPHHSSPHDSSKDFAPLDPDATATYHGSTEPGDASVADAAAMPKDAGQAGGAGNAGSGGANAGAGGDNAAGADAPASGAATLQLGGVELRKEDVIAFIHFGHSNMGGFAMDPPELRPYHFTETNPRVWMYRVGKPPELATEPTAREDRYPTAGPGVALLKQAAELAPKKYFMSLGYGVSGVYCTQFLPGSLYFDSITKSAVAVKDRVTFAAIIVMLGSTEIHGTDEDRAGFASCVNKLVTAVREAIGQPNLPMLMSGYEVGATGMYATDSEFGRKIIAEIEKVPSVVSNSVLIPTDGIAMQDDHHFNLMGHITWTKRVLDKMEAKGWFPWAEIPAPAQNP